MNVITMLGISDQPYFYATGKAVDNLAGIANESLKGTDKVSQSAPAVCFVSLSVNYLVANAKNLF